MELCFWVQAQEDGLFLRDYLRLKRVSASLCSAIKQDKGFFCNGETIYANARVRAGDRISFSLPQDPVPGPRPQSLPLSVVYEDEHAMVLEKPLGQAIHPTLGHPDGTLANAFCGEMQRRGVRALFRPVNRIDKGTSGLVLCAMNAYAAPLLAQSCQKSYYAIVEGHLAAQQGVIDAPIARCEDSIIRREVSAEGKPSKTEYQVLCETKTMSLVRCLPLTGRTHQIRVHFAWLGHPLAGDAFYGGQPVLDRPALHCGLLEFSVLHTVRVGQPLPGDMRALLGEPCGLAGETWLFGEKGFVKEM